MVDISPEAVALLKQIRHGLENIPDSAALRIEAEPEGKGIGVLLNFTTLEPVAEDEQVLDDPDLAVYVSKDIVSALGDVGLYPREADEGPALEWKHTSTD